MKPLFFGVLSFLLLNAALCAAETAAPAGQSRAIEQYRKALEADPANSEVRYYLGQALLRNGDFEGGIEEFLRVYPERKNEEEINYNLAYAYLQTGRLDSAFTNFSVVDSLNSGAAKKFRLDNAFLSLGAAYLGKGSETRAVAAFDRSLRINPDNIKTYLQLVMIYLKRNDYAGALNYLERARQIDGSDEELIMLASNIHNRQGVDYLNRKMYVESREEFQKVLAIDSSNLATLYYLGYLDYLQQDVESAVKNLLHLASLKIEDQNILNGLKPLLYNLGVHYLNGGEPKKALEIMGRLAELFPDYSKALRSKGAAAMEGEAFDLAIESYEAYLKMEPGDTAAVTELGVAYDRSKELHYEKGKALFGEKKYREALAEFDRTVAISPDFSPAAKYRDATVAELEKIRKDEEARIGATVAAMIAEGKGLLQEGELLAAQEKIGKALELDPLNGEAKALDADLKSRRAAEVGRKLAEAEVFMGEEAYYKAANSYKAVRFLEPTHQGAASGLAEAEKRLAARTAALLKEAEGEMTQEHFRKAYESYSKVLELNPENDRARLGADLALDKIEIYFNEYIGMGRDYVKIEQLQMAMNYLNKALALKPGNETALNEISLARQKMGSLKGIDEMLTQADEAYNMGRFTEAISLFSDVLKLDADNGSAATGLRNAKAKRAEMVGKLLSQASSLYAEKRYKETVDLCRKVLSMDGSESRATDLMNRSKNAIDSEANPLMAEAKKHFDGGNMAKAVVLFKQVLKADPGNSAAQRYISKVDTGKVSEIVREEVSRAYLAGLDLYTKGNYEGAIEHWKNVLALEPGHEKALLNIDKAKRKLSAIKGG